MRTNLHSIRSLDEFRANPDKVLSYLRRSGKPVILTQNDEPEIMMIDARKLSKKLNARHLQRLIEEAEADIAANRVEDFGQFMKRFRDAHKL